MNLITILTWAGLALVDSINPNTIIITNIILSKTRSLVKSFIYVGTIFLIYLMMGLAFYFGFFTIFEPIWDTINSYLGVWVEIIGILLGCLCIIYTILNYSKSKIGKTDIEQKITKYLSSNLALIGLGIMATTTDGLTSAPYLFVIGDIKANNLDWLSILFALSIYSLLYLTPCILIIAAFGLFRSNFEIVAKYINVAVDHLALFFLRFGIGIIGLILIYFGLGAIF